MAIADSRRLVGVISAMIVWAAWFVVVYALTGVGCRAGWHRMLLPGGNLLSLSMLISAVVALALIAWCAWLGYAAWRRDPAPGVGREVARRQRFLGLVMLLLSGLAGIGTLLGALPVFMLDPCAT
jgi:hypothetical protein